jgi:hypothetical protein
MSHFKIGQSQAQITQEYGIAIGETLHRSDGHRMINGWRWNFQTIG